MVRLVWYVEKLSTKELTQHQNMDMFVCFNGGKLASKERTDSLVSSTLLVLVRSNKLGTCDSFTRWKFFVVCYKFCSFLDYDKAFLINKSLINICSILWCPQMGGGYGGTSSSMTVTCPGWTGV